jgi:hypothetical protein
LTHWGIECVFGGVFWEVEDPEGLAGGAGGEGGVEGTEGAFVELVFDLEVVNELAGVLVVDPKNGNG